MRLLRALSFAGLAAATFAWGQQPASPFKGKVKPGLYEIRSEADMGNMPGVPNDAKKKVTTRQHCLTDAEIDKLAEEANPACKTTNFRMTDVGASFRISCTGKQEMTSDVLVAIAPAGYVVESKVTVKPAGGGAPVNMTQRAINKYLGPCPAPKK